MNDIAHVDYSVLDSPEILARLFHPRSEIEWIEKPENSIELLIPVEGDVDVGVRLHMTDKLAPNVLFFHGNGEIVSDYNDLGQLYNRIGINFIAVDYRGYGRSTGNPSVTSMMSDCHTVFEFIEKWLAQEGYNGGIVVMGRSLGSAPALELAHRYGSRIDGLIVESGFAYLGPLLALLGVNTSAMDLRNEDRIGNIGKIRSWEKPLLVIHAELDHIIPFSDGQELYESCQSSDKTFLAIPEANHNDILMKGITQYVDAVKMLCESAGNS